MIFTIYYDDIKDYADKLQDKNLLDFISKSVKKNTQLALTNIMLKTPVRTGDMRKAWKTSDTRIKLNSVEIDIINDVKDRKRPIFYASYVNDGHWLRNGKWWEGYHMVEEGLEEYDIFAKVKQSILNDLKEF